MDFAMLAKSLSGPLEEISKSDAGKQALGVGFKALSEQMSPKPKPTFEESFERGYKFGRRL